ncbi:hypothetical protein QCA50_008152 [Cerrena zonata]|uniref:Uncharacterized protein n=1 Tax=Cerrena zonata TaxID=2478898 RepID=A0AAW0GF48_9APHY
MATPQETIAESRDDLCSLLASARTSLSSRLRASTGSPYNNPSVSSRICRTPQCSIPESCRPRMDSYT